MGELDLWAVVRAWLKGVSSGGLRGWKDGRMRDGGIIGELRREREREGIENACTYLKRQDPKNIFNTKSRTPRLIKNNPNSPIHTMPATCHKSVIRGEFAVDY